VQYACKIKQKEVWRDSQKEEDSHFKMKDGNLPGVKDPSHPLLQDVGAESERENTFVTGYMGLMNCSERAARAVYMHVRVKKT
jgi:hypothetical protein